MQETDVEGTKQWLNQLALYADDLATMYRSEKSARNKAEQAFQQLYSCARDLVETVSSLTESKTLIEEAYLDTVHRLALAAEYRDNETGEHICRMSSYCVLLAKGHGLPEDEIQILRHAAPMHDLGKIGIPDSVLLNPGKLSDAEFAIMKQHPLIGARILDGSRSLLLRAARVIAWTHHENYDGSGYPSGAKGVEIPLYGRIVRIADVFDALTSSRPYKGPYPPEIAREMMLRDSGRVFDPILLGHFMTDFDQVVDIVNANNTEIYKSGSKVTYSDRDLDNIGT